MDFQARIDTAIEGIIADLKSPFNRPLLLMIVRFHIEEPDKSFQFDFSSCEPLTYLEYEAYLPVEAGLLQQLGVEVNDTRSTGERYDEYIARHGTKEYIGREMSKALDELTSKYDDGWSGSVYGYIMRNVAEKLFSQNAN